eukprot:150817_1
MNPHFKYESDFDDDFDKKGIFYAIGTDFGAQKYANPAQSGLVDVVSSEMYKGESYSFIGRDNVRACTTHSNVQAYTTNNKGSFFYVDLKKNKIQPAAYTLKNGHYGDYHLKAWNLEASNDGETWICLKKHESDDSLQGKYTSQTWTLNDINQFYSFFRIVMTGQNHAYGNDWLLMCSGMELYGDLKGCAESESMKDTKYVTHGGTISLISDSSVINYGEITSNGAFGGFINITCPIFKNFGRIEAKKNGRIAIQCASFETESEIHPKPLINTPWEYLVLDAKHQFIQFDVDRIPNTQRDHFITFASNTKYQIKYYDAQHVQQFVDEISDEKKEDDTQSALDLIPIRQNPLYSSVEVMVAVLKDSSKSEYDSFVSVKLLHLCSVYHLKQSLPIQINYTLNARTFDMKTGSGGCIEIHSTSAIIIEKNGAINANDCYLLSHFKYESDFDENGIFYAIGTRFGAQKYENPAVCGLVDVVSSSGMGGGESYSFIGRDNVRACTTHKQGSFFYV